MNRLLALLLAMAPACGAPALGEDTASLESRAALPTCVAPINSGRIAVSDLVGTDRLVVLVDGQQRCQGDSDLVLSVIPAHNRWFDSGGSSSASDPMPAGPVAGVPVPGNNPAASDPMPADVHSAASDPMPAGPVAGVPVPQNNPAASDPMPADPGKSASGATGGSDPMPAQPRNPDGSGGNTTAKTGSK